MRNATNFYNKYSFSLEFLFQNELMQSSEIISLYKSFEITYDSIKLLLFYLRISPAGIWRYNWRGTSG